MEEQVGSLRVPMKAETRFYLALVASIVLFDVAGSLASRMLKFDYAALVWPWRFLYLLAGYFGFNYIRLAGAVLAGLVAGIADATIGWALSAAIRPYLPFTQATMSVRTIMFVVVFVSLQAAFFGFVGGLLHLLVSRFWKRSSAPL
jgi:hypothetical protein